MSPIIHDNNPFLQPSFSLGNRLGRLAWGIVYVFLYRPTPAILHRWRAMLLRLFGARIGRRMRIDPNVKVWAPWNLEVGDFVWVGNGAALYSMEKITLEDYSVVSQGAHLCCGSHDINSPNFQLIAAPITIKSRAWVCADAFVGMGVTIAEGAVLGACAVTTKSITTPWTVWGGIPARQIGVRQAHPGFHAESHAEPHAESQTGVGRN